MPEHTEELVKDLARLARIEVSSSEIQELFKSLKAVLDYFDQLQEVDISDLPPYSHVEDQGVEALRKDKVLEPLDRKKFLANAPDQIGGMIRTPPVLKQNQ